jgi:hypothetical protein
VGCRVAERTSLVPETLETMEQDTELQQVLARLQEVGQVEMTREERRQRQRSLQRLGVPSFSEKLRVRLHSPAWHLPAPGAGCALSAAAALAIPRAACTTLGCRLPRRMHVGFVELVKCSRGAPAWHPHAQSDSGQDVQAAAAASAGARVAAC